MRLTKLRNDLENTKLTLDEMITLCYPTEDIERQKEHLDNVQAALIMEKQKLHRTLLQAPPAVRRAMYLHYCEDKTVYGVAEDMHYSPRQIQRFLATGRNLMGGEQS